MSRSPSRYHKAAILLEADYRKHYSANEFFGPLDRRQEDTSDVFFADLGYS